MKVLRVRNRTTGKFMRDRLPVRGETKTIPAGLKLGLAHHYPETHFEYVLEESPGCAVVHSPVEWRHHAIRDVGVCQSCGTTFDCLKIDLAHEAALVDEVDEAHEEARSRFCVRCGSEDSVFPYLNRDRLVSLCPACRLQASA